MVRLSNTDENTAAGFRRAPPLDNPVYSQSEPVKSAEPSRTERTHHLNVIPLNSEPAGEATCSDGDAAPTPETRRPANFGADP